MPQHQRPHSPLLSSSPAISHMHVSGDLRVPGDKSISHRALILAALSSGDSRIRGILQSADVGSTAVALRALGVDVPPLAADICIHGVGRRGLRAPPPDGAIDCGNSGTTARLLAGVTAGHPFAARFTGDESLRRRPMGRIARPLRAMGARVELTQHERMPMLVHGADLRAIHHHSDVASAQVKSAVLLAGLAAGVEVTISEPVLSRDHTERMLAARGAPLRSQGATVTLDAITSLPPADLFVPGDPSSAAFLAALAALATHGELRVRDVCLNPSRTGFFTVLRAMGAAVTLESMERDGEPVGDVVVRGGRLGAVQLEAADVPAIIDELPLLACLASRATGITEVRGAGELRVKESDRIGAVVRNLRAIGAEAEELDDGFRIAGDPDAAPPRGRVRTQGDHRIAMAFGVLGALPGAQVEVDDPDCVTVSFPTFWEQLRAARQA